MSPYLDGELVGDIIPESQGLSILTPRGHVVLLGCGHAGVINTLEHVQGAISAVPIHAVIGGFHLYAADEARLAWTAEKLASIGTENVIGAHCTGIEALFRLREGAHLNRSTAVVGAVGASFTFGKGIDPGGLAK